MRTLTVICVILVVSSVYAGDPEPNPTQQPAPTTASRVLTYYKVTCTPDAQVGQNTACVAFGLYTGDEKALDLTADSLWSRGATPAAPTFMVTVDDARAGTISMSAMFQGHSDTASIKVKPIHVLSYLGVTCNQLTQVKVGDKWTCWAFAWYLDEPDKQINVTGSATWARGPEGAVTEDDAKSGTISVTATFEGMSRSQVFNVTPHVLTKMFIDCPKEEIELAETAACKAYGLFSEDPHTAVELKSAQWSRGPAITATDDDVRAGTISVKAESEGNSASASIKVKPAHVLTSLAVSCSKEEIKVKETAVCTANGKYADVERFVPLTDVVWEKGPEVTATDSDAEVGAIAVTAKLGGLSDTASIKVTPHFLTKMFIDCPEAALGVGQTATCAAYGLYSDDPHTVAKLNARWSRGPEVTATLTDVRVGIISITADFEAFTATTTVKVKPAHILKRLTVSCSSEEIKVGETATCSAGGIYADEDRFVAFTDVEWSNGPTVTATEADAAGGFVQVTARFQGLVDTTSIKVTALTEARATPPPRKAACESATAQLKAIDGILRRAMADGAAVIKLIPKEGEPTPATATAMVNAATKLKELNTSMPLMQTAAQGLVAALQALAAPPGEPDAPAEDPACAPFAKPEGVQAALKTAASSLDDLGDLLANVQGTFSARDAQLTQVATKVKHGLDLGPAAVEKAKASGDKSKQKAAEDALKAISDVGKSAEQEKTNLEQGTQATQQVQNQVGAIKGVLNAPVGGQ